MSRGRHQLQATPWVGLAMLAVVVMVLGAAMIFYLSPWLKGGVQALSPAPPVAAAPTAPPLEPSTVWQLPRSTQHVAPPTTAGVVPDVTCSTP